MTLPTLPPNLMQRGADPDLVKPELTHFITTAINNHPRSQQIQIGPSEIGTPCRRRLGYKLLNTPEVNTDRGAAWKPTVGTAVHTWLQTALQSINDGLTYDRFYLEERVTVGQVNGQDIDVYDRVICWVLDWKIVGDKALRRYRIDGPGEQYRAQAHLYGRGFVAKGQPVDQVAIVFLPQNGELRDMHVWHEPYDEQVALDALNRAEAITKLTSSLGTAALPLLPTADAYCDYCPYKLPAATDLTEACPGHQDPAVATAPAA